MSRANEWASKVLALLRSNNADAAIAQIKVAPSVKDLRQLGTALAAAGLAERWPAVNEAISDNIDALSAPRLHRSP
ncbi:hypothetical protein [Variovorax terrae]|uniref:Uncharacterized protein n=1 Tax=Variovorax terrae TaxID=2923278 RepID=A0A9X2AM67_9BURK|nr:hypothetical protein [Variovorax terrae]MCJ0762979.1 hypothetical protein [Variovorax terrae]